MFFPAHIPSIGTPSCTNKIGIEKCLNFKNSFILCSAHYMYMLHIFSAFYDYTRCISRPEKNNAPQNIPYIRNCSHDCWFYVLCDFQSCLHNDNEHKTNDSLNHNNASSMGTDAFLCILPISSHMIYSYNKTELVRAKRISCL